MNLKFVLMDFITNNGELKTYLFQPINEWTSVLVDKLDDIVIDVKSRMDTDVGLLRVYNSDKCSLSTIKCKLKNFENNGKRIAANFEHLFMRIGSGGGSAACYSFMLPVSYKFTSLEIYDPYQKEDYYYILYYDPSLRLQIVHMTIKPNNEYCSFNLAFQAEHETSNCNFLESYDTEIKLDRDLNDFFFDEGIKRSFFDDFKKATTLEPNFYGISIDLKKLFRKK